MPYPFRSFGFSLVQWAWQLLIPMIAMAASDVPFSYIAYRFESAEQWRIEGRGNIGNSRWEGEYVCVNAIGEENEIKLPPAGPSGLERILALDLKKGSPLYLVRK